MTEIFSVKACDLETRVRGRPRSLEMVPFDRLYTSSYCCGFFEYYNFTRCQLVQNGLKLSKFLLLSIFSLKSFISILPRDAMQARSMLSCGVCLFVCLSVCPSVTFVDHVKTNKHIVTFFSLCGSSIILFFQFQTGWRYSNGNPLTGASNARVV